MGDKREAGYEVADILRKYLSAYLREHKLSYEQRQAVNAIMACRTPALGGVLLHCDHCGHLDFMYKSCKNRHCPKCGSFQKAQWLEAQKLWVLPIQYFHVVFTIDHVFNWLVWHNQEVLYSLIIEVAARLLKRYGEEYLGGEIGFSMVLHTWGQTMQAHPHVHFMVAGGALVSTPEGYRWQAAKPGYLFPVKKLSVDFKQAFCAEVRKMAEKELLNTADGRLDVAGMLAEGLSKDWEVYIQAPEYGVDNLLEYLARYIFRIAISNHRIVDIQHGKVTFEYYDNRQEGKLKRMSLTAEEFIHRFLLHVLPRRFVRIRHFGLHHASCRAKLQEARRLLGLSSKLPVVAKLVLLDWLKTVLKSEADPRLCPYCGKGLLLPLRPFAPISGWRVAISWFIKSFVRCPLPAT
jgi:Putative transposase/Transposase zinc-binding domain